MTVTAGGILYADRRQGILLVPQSRVGDIEIISETTEAPTILITPDDINTPERAYGWLAGYLQGRAGA